MAEKQQDQQVVLGKISGVFGVKGWLKVYSYTSPLESILNYSGWTLERNGVVQTCKIAKGQRHGKGIIVLLEGITNRNQAEEYIGNVIKLDRSELPDVQENEYYWADLEGLNVVTTDGVELGVVEYLFDTGSNDVMHIKGDKARLLPFIDQVVKEVNLKEGLITVDWDPDF